MRQNHLLADGFFYAKKGEHRNVYFRGEQEKSLQHCFFEQNPFWNASAREGEFNVWF